MGYGVFFGIPTYAYLRQRNRTAITSLACLFLGVATLDCLVASDLPSSMSHLSKWLNTASAEQRINKGREWAEKGEYDKALEEFNTAIKLNPSSSTAYVERGKIWEKRKYDSTKERSVDEIFDAITDPLGHGRSSKDFDEAIRLDPRNSEARRLRGDVAWKTQERESAIGYYDQAIQLDGRNSEAFRGRGWARLVRDDYHGANADFDEAIRLDPRCIEALRGRGWARKARGDLDGAIQDFDEAIRFKERDTESYRGRGLAWAEKGKLDLAMRDLGYAVQFSEGGSMGYLSRGWVWERQREYAKARTDYEEVVRLAPQDSDGYVALAWLLATCPDANTRDGKRAVELAKKAQELGHKRRAWASAVLAAAYAELANHKEAVKHETIALEDPAYHQSEARSKPSRLELYQLRQPYRQSP